MTSSVMVRAAFLDRDGVINVDSGYVHRVADFQFIPGALNACRLLQVAGFKLIVVTNQAGIAHGLYGEQEYKELTGWMMERFREAGAPLTGVYHCPHHPNARVLDLRCECHCRKPAPGMIELAIREHGIDPANSFIVGDKESDLEAGEKAGIADRYLVRAAVGKVDQVNQAVQFESLGEVVRHILKIAGPDI